MSIFGKAWRVVKSARHVVAVIADAGDAIVAIVGSVSAPIRRIVEAAKKADAVADEIEKAGKA